MFPSRVQVLITGKFIAFFLAGLSLLGGGYQWYSQQEQNQKRFQIPPYFVNRGATIIRKCGRCLDIGKLTPQPDWKIGSAKEIPATEQRWFLAVEDPPMPVTVSGVLMLPVHPAYQVDPTFGFDQNRVELVLYQNLQRKPWVEKPGASLPIELPPPQSQPPPSLPPKPSPVTESAAPDPAPEVPPTAAPAQSPFVGEWKNEDPGTQSHTRLVISDASGRLMIHAWGRCSPQDCDWQQTEATGAGEGLAALWDQKFVIRHWKLTLGSDGRLTLSEHNHYADARGDRDDTSVFVRTQQ